MVRKYIKKTNRGNFSQATLRDALNAVKNGKKVREAAREYGLSHATILRYKKNESDPTIQHPGANPVFSNDEERKLSKHISECADMYHGLSLKQSRELAFQYAVELGKTNIPKSWHENRCAGRPCGQWNNITVECSLLNLLKRF